MIIYTLIKFVIFVDVSDSTNAGKENVMRIALLDSDLKAASRIHKALGNIGIRFPAMESKDGGCLAYGNYCPKPEQEIVFAMRAKDLEPWLQCPEPTLVFVHWVQNVGFSYVLEDEEVRTVRAAAPRAGIVLTRRSSDHVSCCLNQKDRGRYYGREYPPEADGGLKLDGQSQIEAFAESMWRAVRGGGNLDSIRLFWFDLAYGKEHDYESVFAYMISVVQEGSAVDAGDVLVRCKELFRDTPRLLDDEFSQKWASLFAT